MSETPSYVKVNQANWNERAPIHAVSPDYAVENFKNDSGWLSQVVQFDLPRLPNLEGLDCVHLQCHIGTDTLSLARLGAHSVVGLDFSQAAIDEARKLVAASAGGDKVTFVCSDIYEAANVLPKASFDLVFTGIGALCWIPSISRWAATVSALLKPGGRLFIREGHPMLWTMGEYSDRLQAETTYFEREESTKYDEPGTYVEHGAYVFKNTKTEEFNHGMAEIITALMKEGLRLEKFEEHDTVPWNALPGQMDQAENGEWKLRDRPWRCPLSYTIVACKE